MSDVQPNRRTDDGEKAATIADVMKLLHEMKASQDAYLSAFVLDDLGKPDFTGHRLSHKASIDRATRIQQDKNSMTKTLLEWIMKGALAFGGLVVQHSFCSFPNQ